MGDVKVTGLLLSVITVCQVIWRQCFIPGTAQHPPNFQPQKLSFITCEGPILSVAATCLFINHSPGQSNKDWLLMWPCLPNCTIDPAGPLWLVSVCVHKHSSVLCTECRPGYVKLCVKYRAYLCYKPLQLTRTVITVVLNVTEVWTQNMRHRIFTPSGVIETEIVASSSGGIKMAQRLNRLTWGSSVC